MFVAPVFASIAFALLLAGSLAIAVLCLRVRRLSRAVNGARNLHRQVLDAEEMLIRRMRLAAHDVRGVGMTLHGHADHLVTAGHPDAAGIATGAADLLDLADDLQDHTMPGATVRVLREETLPLGDALDDAIAAVAKDKMEAVDKTLKDLKKDVSKALEAGAKELKEVKDKLDPVVAKAAELTAKEKAKKVEDALTESMGTYVKKIAEYKDAVTKQPAGHDAPLIDMLNVRQAFTQKGLQEQYVKAAENFLKKARIWRASPQMPVRSPPHSASGRGAVAVWVWSVQLRRSAVCFP